MNIKDRFFATGIGSLPFREQGEAVDFVLNNFEGNIPFWPQLPRRSFLESMHIQFSEGFPGVVLDRERKSISVNTREASFIEAFERCYHALNSGELGYFAMSPDYAAGFHEFLQKIASRRYPFVKGQVIGPISFGAMLLDDKKKPVLFDAELSEIIPLFLSGKTKWQIEKMKEATDDAIIIFIDEPYLVAVGSNEFAALERASIAAKINTLVEAIHREGAVAGIHCCGNTDWSICFETDIDILSFDAFEFMDSLFIYRDSLRAFVKKGGVLACGIVPNREDYDLGAYQQVALDALRKERILLENGALITSSCGCGSVAESFAMTANRLTVAIAQALAFTGQ